MENTQTTQVAKRAALEPALTPLVPEPSTLAETARRALETLARRGGRS
jgi:hypothetical protein